MDVITAVRWKERTLIILRSIWKCKTLPKSRSETHVSSARYSYHDVVQRAANSSHRPPPQTPCRQGLNVWMELFRMKWCDEQLYNYWRLLFLILYLPYIKERCPMQLVSIVISYVYVLFVEIMWWVWSWNPHYRGKNSPNAVSVQLCEQHTVALAVHLHLYFHSVHNSPNAVSVQLCEQHTVAVAVDLHLYFHSVHNSPNAVSVQLCEQHTVAVAVHLHLYFHSVHS